MTKKSNKMGLAIVKSKRVLIILLHDEGVSKTEISAITEVRYRTVSDFIRRYESSKDNVLHTSYHRSGRKTTDEMQFYKRICLWLKRRHPEWGAPIIRVVMTNRYGTEGIPCIRQMQKWFMAARLNKPRQRNNRLAIGPAVAVHNIWQVDAKERFTLAAGQAADYLTIVDEKSGAWLEAPLFPLFSYQSSSNLYC
jgi:hypothetical protein